MVVLNIFFVIQEQDAIALLEEHSKAEDIKMSQVQQQERDVEEQRKALEEEKNTLAAADSMRCVEN